MTTKILGMDISLNHGAIVELVDGNLTNFWYYTNIAGSATRSKRGFRIDPDIYKTKDKHRLSVARLAWVKKFMTKVIRKSKADYAGLEDYAIRAEQGAHYLGEAGGAARMALWDAKIPFRLHDPTSVKMYVAHDGTCQKDAIQRAVEKRWDVSFDHCDVPKSPRAKKANKTTSEDLADAYGIAQMVRAECRLRSGEIALNTFHEREIRVFNRVTKTYSVNLLDREWIIENV